MSAIDVTAKIASALALITLASHSVKAQEQVEKPVYEFEKCYAVSGAGQNDCFTANGACGKTQEEDRDPAYWVYVPKGTCEKLAGGSLQAK